MRYVFTLILLMSATLAGAADWEDQQVFNPGDGRQVLRVISNTDTSVFLPILEGYLAKNPDVSIAYFVASSQEVYERFRNAPEQFDLVISSAMDLQLKLVNDGFAQRVENVPHPSWAQWRESLFGFTREPAAIVINRDAFSGLAIPRSRQELIEILRAHPDRFRARAGTYDIRQSGLGYLFATQDARASETYWRLMEVMGSLQARLYCCSGDMIDDLASGKLAVSYNVLESYVSARTDIPETIQVILPSDFPTTMMRTVFVAREAASFQQAIDFVKYLSATTLRGPDLDRFALPALGVETNLGAQSTITLDPGLMIFLDDLKRRTFIAEWENAVIQ